MQEPAGKLPSRKDAGYHHSELSVNPSSCIETHDRAALKRLLRYGVRP